MTNSKNSDEPFEWVNSQWLELKEQAIKGYSLFGGEPDRIFALELFEQFINGIFEMFTKLYTQSEKEDWKDLYGKYIRLAQKELKWIKERKSAIENQKKSI